MCVRVCMQSISFLCFFWSDSINHLNCNCVAKQLNAAFWKESANYMPIYFCNRCWKLFFPFCLNVSRLNIQLKRFGSTNSQENDFVNIKICATELMFSRLKANQRLADWLFLIVYFDTQIYMASVLFIFCSMRTWSVQGNQFFGIDLDLIRPSDSILCVARFLSFFVVASCSA